MQPQRIRVRGDENAPVLAANKTLQRNKSTTALASNLQNGANKNGTRRAAFGDVSNTANLVQGSRDDASLAGKKPSKALEKASLDTEKKPAVLSQPAQRPMSISNLKGLLNNVTNPKPLEATKQPIGQQQGANSRKTLNKRATVFKDLEPLTENSEHSSKETIIEVKEDSKNSSESIQHTAKEAVNSDNIREDQQEASLVKSEADEEADHTSELEDDDCKVQAALKHISESGKVHVTADLHDPKIASKSSRKPSTVSRISQDYLPHQSEPEEYWDEEDEENEEDDGYITARSYRSRSENTTGGATTLLFPRFNQQAKRELALAKQVVEATRTVEDIEDDYCDTSMVAEYNEEIFEYMKEQEVCLTTNKKYRPYSHLIIDQDAAQRTLHGQPSRDPVVNAICPHGLACSSSSPLLTAP